MDGRILWYKPGARRGRLASNAGRRFPFETPSVDDAVHGGARVVFQVAETDGELIAVNVRVVQSCVEALLDERADLARQFHAVVAIEHPPTSFAAQPAPAASHQTP